jgi:rhodanese-related sulfurtransferase
MDTMNFSIKPSELLKRIQRLESANAPLILDVRKAPAFDKSAHMIAGALRCLPDQVVAFVQSQSPQDSAHEIIVYCVYGHAVSQGAAALLRSQGWNARFLAGGIAGGEDGVDAGEDIARWRATALPMVQK